MSLKNVGINYRYSVKAVKYIYKYIKLYYNYYILDQEVYQELYHILYFLRFLVSQITILCSSTNVLSIEYVHQIQSLWSCSFEMYFYMRRPRIKCIIVYYSNTVTHV